MLDSAAPPSSSARTHLRALQAWVEANLERPFTREDLCRAVGVSPRTLHRLFLRRFGQPPMKHVAARRLAKARARLLERRRDDSVTRVALECGFGHLSRFAALYRVTYGETPSESLRSPHPARG